MVAPILAVSGPSGAGKTTVGRIVASTFELSVHLQIDAFMPFVVNGWIDPWLPEAAEQNHVLGGAAASAAMQFAAGGYLVILDGNLFPDGVDGFGQACRSRRIALHYVVLRPDLATCLGRASSRVASGLVGRPEYANVGGPRLIADQYARFADLGRYENHVVHVAGPPKEVANTVISAFKGGALAVTS